MQHAEAITACGKKVAQGIFVCEIAAEHSHIFRNRISKRVFVHDQRQNAAAVCQQKLKYGSSEEAGGTGDQVILIHHTSSFGNPTDVDYLS